MGFRGRGRVTEVPFYVSERVVEVPFVLENARPPTVLDIGRDRTGEYTRALEDNGLFVESVDPNDRKATYRIEFEHLNIPGNPGKRYDTVLFLSSLEHFNYSLQNLSLADNDIYCISKARTLLAPGGIIIITVPFGKEYIPGDFIQWSKQRVDRVVRYCGIHVLKGMVMRCDDNDDWSIVREDECADVQYRTDGRGANAVYMGVWQ